MSTKTDQKRDLILKKAREVFVKKGFKEVTMKDIVEACEISRGGLYLYYDNTRDLFADVLKRENKVDEGDDNVFSNAVKEQASASDLLALFLQEQKKELLGKEVSIGIATYEFYFTDIMATGKSEHRSSMKSALSVIEGLLKRGNAEGDLFCADPHAEALNMVMSLEGMRILSKTGGITDREISDEILYLLGGVLTD